MSHSVVVIEPIPSQDDERIIVQPPPSYPPPPTPIPEQIKDWLMERNYQFKKEGDGHKITRKDSRNENLYLFDIELARWGHVILKEVSFKGNWNGTVSISIDGVETAGFKVDEYGNLRAVDPSANR